MSATMGESAFAGGTLGRGGSSCYPAPWSKVQKWVSILVVLLLAYALVMLLWVVPSAGLQSISVAVVLGIFAAGLLSLVRGYEVTDVEIVVRRLGWRNRFPIAGLVEVRADAGLTRGSLRLFGNGGFLSTTGVFWNRRLGRYRLLANDVSRSVLLRYADRAVVVAPEHPARFASDVAHRAGLVA